MHSRFSLPRQWVAVTLCVAVRMPKCRLHTLTSANTHSVLTCTAVTSPCLTMTSCMVSTHQAMTSRPTSTATPWAATQWQRTRSSHCSTPSRSTISPRSRPSTCCSTVSRHRSRLTLQVLTHTSRTSRTLRTHASTTTYAASTMLS